MLAWNVLRCWADSELVFLRNTHVTDAGVKKLQKARPDRVIITDDWDRLDK